MPYKRKSPFLLKGGLLLCGVLIASLAIVAFWATRPDEAIDRTPGSFEKALEPAAPVPLPGTQGGPESRVVAPPVPSGGSAPAGEATPDESRRMIYKTKNIQMPIVPAPERPLPPGSRIAEPGEPEPPTDMSPPK